jgi:chaperonin GroES
MIKPLSDRLVVKEDQSESKTATGIFIPDTAKEKTQTGTVVAIGPGKSKDEPMSLAEGMRIMYAKHSGTKVQIDGQDYLIMKEGDVWAVL